MSEKEWLASIVRGEERGLKALFGAYFERLCAFSRTLGLSQEDAEDEVAEVFARLWHKRTDAAEIRDPRSYLFTAVKNRSLKRLTKKLVAVELVDELPAPDTTDGNYDMENLQKRIDSLIEALPLQCKTIFYLSRNEKIPHAEIAQILQISIRTVEAQIYKALTIIRNGIHDLI